ncbi:MAG TPA: hypothetical protein VNJ08_17845 [Bacteriovoracaceae bacterium]|nr:hypothetical protein [Bacteriovoracaceae bacterium]
MKFADLLCQNPKTRFLTILLFCFIAYTPVLITPQTISPDAYFILPLFDRMYDLQGYLEYLLALKTIDIQPVRDLSLLIDWKIFKFTGFNSFIFQNVILWVISCFFVTKVLEELFEKLEVRVPFVLGLCYSVYPLFSASIGWSIARKHILAFLFTILATYYLLKFLKSQLTRHLIVMNLCYFLGIFSQPIGILWPLWAFSYVYFYKKESWPVFKKGFAFVILSFIVGFTIQYIYYSKSALFASIFNSKTAEVFDLKHKLFAFGHYMFQVFSPYSLAFPYSLDLWKVTSGYIFLFIFIVIFKWIRLPTGKLALWLMFAFLPLSIILNTPRLLLDPYLLIPSFGFLVLICMMYEQRPIKWLKYPVLPILLIWTVLTNINSKIWTDETLFTQRNFKRAPNCINAMRLGRSYYDQEKKMPMEARNFLASHNCIQPETPYAGLEMQVFLSQFLYYEDHVSYEKKLQLLEEMGEKFFYPKFILAALLLRNGKEEEALRKIKQVVDENGGLVLDTAADPIIPRMIHPFCERIGYLGCLKITRQVEIKRTTPYF